MPTTYACPECDAPLQSPRALPAGKKIKCPKCGTIFPVPGDEDEEADGAIPEKPHAAVPVARKRVRPVVEDEEEDDADEDEPEDDRPRRKRPRRPQKARAGNKGLLIGLIIGGAALLLLGGGGVGTYLWLNAGKNRGPSNEDPLAYVPADSALIFGVSVARLMEQPGAGEAVEQALQRNTGGGTEFINSCKKNTGLEFKDLCQQVIVAVKAPAGGGNPGIPPMGAGGPPGVMGAPVGVGATQNMTMIIQSRVPFNQFKIRDSAKDAKAKKLGGKTLYRVNERDFTTLYMPSDRVIVLTSLPESDLGSILNSNGKDASFSADAALLARTGEEGLFWVVAPLDAAMKQTMQQNMGGVPPPMRPLADALLSAKAAGFWVFLENDKLKVHASLTCADSQSAQKAAESLQNAWNTQIKGLLPLLAMANLPREVQTAIQELADSVQFSAQGATARMSAQVNRQVLDAVVKQMQQGGMPGMPPGGMGPGGRPRPGAPPGPSG